MRKWIFVAMAVVAAFAMVSCGGGNDDTKPLVTITFELGVIRDDVPVTGTAPAPVKINKGKTVKLPDLTDVAPSGWGPNGWLIKDTTTAVTANTTFDKNTTIVAQWTDGCVKLTFDYNYTGATNPTAYIVPEDTPIELSTYKALPKPTALVRSGNLLFTGWYNTPSGASIRFKDDSAFSVDTTLYARWASTAVPAARITEATEALYLTNGGRAVYRFDLDEGKTLDDYASVSLDIAVSEAGLHIWKEVGSRSIRLYGVYDTAALAVKSINGTAGSPYEDLTQVDFYNLNNYNSGYIVNNPAESAQNDFRDNAVAGEWFSVTHPLFDGTDNAKAKPGSQSGVVYFGVGLSCQKVNADGRTREENTFPQLVRNIKLNPKAGTGATTINGVKPTFIPAKWLVPAYTPGQFVAYQDPIVYEWRGNPSDFQAVSNYNTTTLPNAIPSPPFDRGAKPAPASLDKIQLHLEGTPANDPNFTYKNKGNPNNQAGWASFTEAGRANDQGATVTSTIAFENFKEAFYLELVTEDVPSGTVEFVWMGDYGGWNAQAVTNTSGVPSSGRGMTIDVDASNNTNIIRFYLPESCVDYQRYYEDNKEWATLCIQYWGASSANLTTLKISEAYLLVKSADKKPAAVGIASGITFKLKDPPASGAVIDDIILNAAGDELTITAASGLTDYVWYVDGTKDSETTDTLTITSGIADGDNLSITLQAKRSGKWVSQVVFITIGTN